MSKAEDVANKLAYHLLRNGNYEAAPQGIDMPELLKPSSIKFNDVKITRDQFVNMALFFKDLSYNTDSTFVQYVDGKPEGHANCFGIFILALQRLGVTALNPNLPWSEHKQTRAQTLIDILNENFVQMTREEMRHGDILLFRWKDQNHRLKTVHHVGMLIAHPEDEQYGIMLHALDRESGGLDKINIHRMTTLDYSRLEQVWALKNFTD